MTKLKAGVLGWLIVALAGMLPACASSNALPARDDDPLPIPSPEEQAEIDARTIPGLPPQPLAPGECGAFFWDRAEPNTLRFFENESQGVARFWAQGEVNELPTQSRRFAYQIGDRIARRYAFSSGVVEVEGRVTDLFESEAVIGRAILRVEQADFSQIVRPLVGLISCQPESTGH